MDVKIPYAELLLFQTITNVSVFNQI